MLTDGEAIPTFRLLRTDAETQQLLNSIRGGSNAAATSHKEKSEYTRRTRLSMANSAPVSGAT